MLSRSSSQPCCRSSLPVSLQGEPLRRYFHGLYSQAELNAFEANMYLASWLCCCPLLLRCARALQPPRAGRLLGGRVPPAQLLLHCAG